MARVVGDKKRRARREVTPGSRGNALMMNVPQRKGNSKNGVFDPRKIKRKSSVTI